VGLYNGGAPARLAPEPTAATGWEPELAKLRHRIALTKQRGGNLRVDPHRPGHPGTALVRQARRTRLLAARQPFVAGVPADPVLHAKRAPRCASPRSLGDT